MEVPTNPWERKKSESVTLGLGSSNLTNDFDDHQCLLFCTRFREQISFSWPGDERAFLRDENAPLAIPFFLYGPVSSFPLGDRSSQSAPVPHLWRSSDTVRQIRNSVFDFR